jgi:hypothetical protein
LRFDSYRIEGFHDEMFAADGEVRAEARMLLDSKRLSNAPVLLRAVVMKFGDERRTGYSRYGIGVAVQRRFGSWCKSLFRAVCGRASSAADAEWC